MSDLLLNAIIVTVVVAHVVLLATPEVFHFNMFNTQSFSIKLTRTSEGEIGISAAVAYYLQSTARKLQKGWQNIGSYPVQCNMGHSLLCQKNLKCKGLLTTCICLPKNQGTILLTNFSVVEANPNVSGKESTMSTASGGSEGSSSSSDSSDIDGDIEVLDHSNLTKEESGFSLVSLRVGTIAQNLECLY